MFLFLKSKFGINSPLSVNLLTLVAKQIDDRISVLKAKILCSGYWNFEPIGRIRWIFKLTWSSYNKRIRKITSARDLENHFVHHKPSICVIMAKKSLQCLDVCIKQRQISGRDTRPVNMMWINVIRNTQICKNLDFNAWIHDANVTHCFFTVQIFNI